MGFNALRTRQHVRVGGPGGDTVGSLIEGYSWDLGAWDFSAAPSSPGSVPELNGGTSLSLLSGTYSLGYGVGSTYASAIGRQRLLGALRADTARFTINTLGTSNDVHIRILCRFPENGDPIVFDWGNTVGNLEISRLSTVRGRVQFSLIQGSTLVDERVIDVGRDGWYLIDAAIRDVGGTDTRIEYGINGVTSAATLGGVTYGGFPTDFHVAQSSFAGGDLLFVGLRTTSTWTTSDHAKDIALSGLDYVRSDPADFLRVAEDARADIPSATVDSQLDGQEEVLVSLLARRARSEDNQILAGRLGQIELRTQDIGAALGTSFATENRELVEAYDWKAAWDFSAGAGSDVPAFAGGRALTLASGTYTTSQSTGNLVADAILAARVDEALTFSGSPVFTAAGGVLTVGQQAFHLRLICTYSATETYFVLGDPAGRRLSLTANALSYHDDTNALVLTQSLTGVPGSGEWMVIDIVLSEESDTEARADVFVNGTAVNVIGSRPWTGIETGQLTMSGFSGSVLFFGLREASLSETVHYNDVDASGLAASVFDTFAWDYAWNLADTVAYPGSAPQTDVCAAYAGSVNLDMNFGTSPYLLGQDTGPIRASGVPTDTIDQAINFNSSTSFQATDASIISSTPYHARVIAQMPTASPAQPALITVGSKSPNQYWYVYAQPNLGDGPGRIVLRAFMTGVSSTPIIVDDIRPAQWMLIDAWVGPDPGNGSNILFLLRVNGLVQSVSIAGSYAGPTQGEISVGNNDVNFIYNSRYVFAAARRTAVPPTAEEHERDWIRSGIAKEYADAGASFVDTSLVDNAWHHLSFLYRGGSSILAAVDGQLANVTASSILPRNLPESAEDFRLGGDALDIAELRIWPTTNFTSDDFARLYRQSGSNDIYKHSTSGAYYNALTSLTGLTSVGYPLEVAETDPDIIEAPAWDQAWDFTVLGARTPGADFWNPTTPPFYITYAADTAHQNTQDDLADATEFTVEFWFRSSAAVVGTERIVSYLGMFDIFRFDDAGTTRLRARLESSTYVYTSDAAVSELEDGAWHHYAVVFEIGTGITMYVDGSPEAGTGVGTVPVTPPTGSNVIIGNSNPGLGDSDVSGAFDIARLYITRKALSASVIANLYTDFTDRNTGPLEAWPGYRVWWDDGSGPSYETESSVSNERLTDGTSSGTITVVYNEDVSALEGSSPFHVTSGSALIDKGTGNFSDADIGAARRDSLVQSVYDVSFRPLQFINDNVPQPSGPFHTRLIFRLRKPDIPGDRRYLIYQGYSSQWFQCILYDTLNVAGRFDLLFGYYIGNGLVLNATLTSTSTSGVLADGEICMMDVWVGPDPDNTNGSRFVIAINGIFTYATTPTTFAAPVHNVCTLNGDRFLQRMGECDFLFAGWREGEYSYAQHTEDLARGRYRSVLTAGRYWDHSWDFGRPTATDETPVPGELGALELALSAGSYTPTSIDTPYSQTFSDIAIGRRETFALFGSSGALFTVTDAYFAREDGLHFRIIARATGSAVTLLSVSAASTPNFTVAIDGSGHVVATYDDGSSTVTATANAGLAANEWVYIDTYVHSALTSGSRVSVSANGVDNATDSAVDFLPFGTNTLEIGGSSGVADSDDLGLLYVGCVGPAGSHLLTEKNRANYFQDSSLHWDHAFVGSGADNTDWDPYAGSLTLTAGGTSTFNVRTGRLSVRDITAAEINEAVKRSSGSSHAAASGFEYPPPDRPYHIRCLVRPTTAGQAAGQVLFGLIEATGGPVDRFIGIRRTASAFEFCWFTEDSGSPGNPLTTTTLALSDIVLADWNLIDIQVTPNEGGGTTALTVFVNGAQDATTTVTYGDPTFGAANVGLGLLNDPAGGNALVDAEMCLWGLQSNVIVTLNEHRGAWQGSGLSQDDMISFSEHQTWYNMA